MNPILSHPFIPLIVPKKILPTSPPQRQQFPSTLLRNESYSEPPLSPARKDCINITFSNLIQQFSLILQINGSFSEPLLGPSFLLVPKKRLHKYYLPKTTFAFKPSQGTNHSLSIINKYKKNLLTRNSSKQCPCAKLHANASVQWQWRFVKTSRPFE